MSDAQKVFSIVSEKPTQTSDAKPGKFGVGDSVQLKGGTRVMTVEKCSRGRVGVVWHTEAGELAGSDFPAAMLQIAELLIDVEPEEPPLFDP